MKTTITNRQHIFFVHSHICYAVCLGIIAHEKLPLNDVIFITDRNYRIPDHSKTATPALDEHWFTIEKNIFKGWENMRRIEGYIHSLCQTEFEYYCPHTLSHFNNFMANHPKCRAIHMIEEGCNSYLSTNQINTIHPPRKPDWKSGLWSRLFYKGRFHTTAFYSTAIAKAYCTHEEAFPDSPNRIILPLDFSRTFKDGLAAELRNVLALDSAVETKYASAENYMSGIRKLVEHIKSNETKVEELQVKLHPYQYVKREFADQVLALLRRELSPLHIIELSPDTAIEAMKPAPGARLYLGISSLSIYATRIGIPCYSFAQEIAHGDSKYRARLAQQPKAFFDSVHFI